MYRKLREEAKTLHAQDDPKCFRTEAFTLNTSGPEYTYLRGRFVPVACWDEKSSKFSFKLRNHSVTFHTCTLRLPTQNILFLGDAGG